MQNRTKKARTNHPSYCPQAKCSLKPRGPSHIAVLRVAKKCEVEGEVWFGTRTGTDPPGVVTLAEGGNE